MSANQILPINNQITASGTGQKANGIVQTQNPQNDPDSAWVLCDTGTVYINGNLQINPPLPVIDTSKIQSQDLSSKIQCNNGGTISVTGTIDNYSTTQQTDQAISNAISGLVEQTYLEQNYSTTVETNQLISDATSGLVQQTFLEANYSTTTQTQNYVNQQISTLDTIYYPQTDTINDILPPTQDLDLNSQKIINLQAGTLPTHAVNLSQLSGYLPTNANLNSLQPQTANYDTSGFQLSVQAAPFNQYSLTNKNYVDTGLSGKLNNSVTLNQINVPTGSVDLNNQRIINLAVPQNPYDAVNIQYANAVYVTLVNLTQILLGYVTTGYLTANYYTASYIDQYFQPIAQMVNYITNSQLMTALSSYVQTSFLTSNYTNNTTLQSTYATISSLSNYLLTSTANSTFQTIAGMSSYLTQSLAASTYQTISGMSSYLLTATANSTFQTIAGMSSYLTQSLAASTYQTISGMSSYVTSAFLTAQNYLKTSDIALYTTEIKTNSTVKSKVSCASASEILFNVNDVQKLKMYIPSGQSTSPCGLIADDKIQIVSNLNSFGFNGNQAIQTGGTNYTGIYISGTETLTENMGGQLCVQPSSTCQNLTLASGKLLIGGVQVPYSALSNASGSPQNNLQISGGTPQTDPTLQLYSTAYAAILGTQIPIQFTSKTGYSTTTTINQPNQFTSKTFVDSSISALSSVYQSISGMSSYLTISSATSTYLSITNAASTYLTQANATLNYYTKTYIDNLIALYYTKIQSDARYYQNTVELNNITLASGDINANNHKITGCLDPTNNLDVANKQYVLSQTGGSFTQAVADTLYYKLAGSNTVTANLDMGLHQINNVITPTLTTDVANKSYVDARAPFKTSLVTVGAWTSSTTNVAVTSVSGFVTSAFKRTNATTYSQQYVVINYANPGYTPIFMISMQVGVSGVLLSQGMNHCITAISTTQATFTFTIPGQLTQVTVDPFIVYIQMMSNTLT